MPEAHCKKHKEFTQGCSACGVARIVAYDKRETDQGCRCPVFFPDYCPVHGG